MNTSPVHAGADSISFTPNGWGGLQFVANGSEFNLHRLPGPHASGSTAAAPAAQTIWVVVTDNYIAVSATIDVATLVPGGVIEPNTWQQATLDFDAQGLTSGTFNGLNIMDGTGTLQQPLYIDDIVFDERTTAPPGGDPVAVTSTRHRTCIRSRRTSSASRSATRRATHEIGYTVRSLGRQLGHALQLAGRCAQHRVRLLLREHPGRERPHTVPPIGNDADAFVGAALGAGSQPLMTIPTIGWTPRADSPLMHPYFAGFSVARYGAQQSIDPYDTDAGNGNHTDGSPITGNDPHDTSSEVDAAFQQGWIAHFQSTFGTAASGGVRFYSLDNEVMLWNSTHRDVHPDPTTYDETWANARELWRHDQAAGSGRARHGSGHLGLLRSFRLGRRQLPRRPRSPGARRHAVRRVVPADRCAQIRSPAARMSSTTLDLHYYPQGQNVALSDDDSPATAARRLRSLKELYDPAWVSESWISDLGDTDANHYDKPT